MPEVPDRQIGSEIGIDWTSAPFGVEQFQMGMDVESEQGLRDPATDVTGGDPIVTGKIALAHLKEFPDSTCGSRRWSWLGRLQRAA